jgi:hypothetical protein
VHKCTGKDSPSGETSQRLVTQRLNSFGDFCERARTLESSTNDSNLFDKSFEESFDQSFAHWVLKITKIHNLVENNTKSISAI